MLSTSQRASASKSVSPDFMEARYGVFPGYVDVIDHAQQTSVLKTHFCRTVFSFPSIAEEQEIPAVFKLRRLGAPRIARRIANRRPSQTAGHGSDGHALSLHLVA